MINERFVKYWDKFGPFLMAVIVFSTISWLFWESDFKPILFGYPKPNIEVKLFCLSDFKHIVFWVLNVAWSLILLKVVEFKSKQ